MEQFQPSPIEVNAALSHIAGRQEERMTAEAQSRTYAERIAAVTAAMHKTKSGAVAKDVHNTYKGVTETPGLDHLFAKNTLTGDIVTRYEYDTRKYGFGDIRIQAGVKIDETELARIWRLLNSIYGVDFGLERVRSAVNESANRCRFNPILNYLKSLKWDGTPRIDTWLIDCAGAEDSQYARAVSAKWLMQCCARAIEPGCHADCVLILEGSQGAGKNTLMEALLPVSDWGVSLSSSSIDKDTVVSLEGKWIGEFAEMHTASRTDVKLLKAFITQRIDHYRKAYRRDHKSNPRLTVFWAATNDSEYLADDTGGRRWWPVEVRGVVHVEEIKDDDGSPKLFLDAQSVRDLRDQLWGEAFARVRSGESYKLTSSEARIAEEKQKAKLIVDPWESVVVEHLENFQVDTGFSTTTLLANAIGMETARQNVTEERRVAKILRKLGYEQRRQYEIDGSRPRRWYKK